MYNKNLSIKQSFNMIFELSDNANDFRFVSEVIMPSKSTVAINEAYKIRETIDPNISINQL